MLYYDYWIQSFVNFSFSWYRTGFVFLFGTDLYWSLIWAYAPQFLSKKKKKDFGFNIVQYSLKNWDAYAQINEAYDKSVPKTNTIPVLIERKQDDEKRFGLIFDDNIMRNV